jgi:hypothetical protein
MAVDPTELKDIMRINAENTKWEAIDASDEEDEAPVRQDKGLAPVELSLRGTSTINPQRPRTRAAGYAPDPVLDDEGNIIDYSEYGTMTVVFRGDKPGEVGVWWNYYDIHVNIWEEFKNAQSKGKYLKSSGLDEWGNMGVANQRSMNNFQRGALNAIVAGSKNFQEKSADGINHQREYTGSIKRNKPNTTWNLVQNQHYS